MKRKIILLTLFICTYISYAQVLTNTESPFSFPITYKGEVVSNLMGGIAAGSEYLGYGTIGINFDTEKAKFWNGGSFYIEGASTHGGSPSADYIGDAQVASNIEAGNYTYLQRLHFNQQIGNFYTSLGLLDLNDDFACCESAQLFHNSSFGVHSVMSYNFDAPIFPVTGLGFLAGYKIGEHWDVKAGIYDGSPIQFDDGNPYNLRWELNINKGYLLTAEVQYQWAKGTYNINGFYHTAIQRRGLSLAIDQNIIETERHKLNAFFYSAIGDKKSIKIVKYNFNAGLKLDGIFSKKMNDSMGLGCASTDFVDGYVETALEFIYSYNFGSWFSLEADVQYIINPPCYDPTAFNTNALVTCLRFTVTL